VQSVPHALCYPPRSLNPMTRKTATHRAAGTLPACRQPGANKIEGIDPQLRQLLVVANHQIGPARQMIDLDMLALSSRRRECICSG